MDSPLTRQARPDAFEPKVVELYRHLFHVLSNNEHEDSIPTEGFWRELFLLKPDKQRLYEILEPLTADDALHIQAHTRLFFRRAVEEAGSGISPRNENALENLTGFMSAILTKRYLNPSTDVIEVLGGLNAIDRLVTELVSGLETIIRQSPNTLFRQKAVDTALSMVSGSYQTSLVTYFIHRDLFPALMKYAQETEEQRPEILVLLGLLSNYNKFESQNLYQNRLEDYVNESIIIGLVEDFIGVCETIRESYTTIQDDTPAPWTITATLQMVGLRALTPEANKPQPPTEEEAKILFNNLPASEASIILAAYSFVHANKIFATHLISSTISKTHKESPLSTFFSTTSYLCHHAHRNIRTLHYSILSLLTIRMLIEDSINAKKLSSTESKVSFRLARQRPPHLPYISGGRVPSTAILDICTDTISHNLRKRLSVPLYNVALTVLHSLITHLDSTKTRLSHHWPYIWGSLFSLLRFLTQYASDLTSAPSQATQIRLEICTPLTSLLAFCLSRGDNFLPDPTSYDDLFYKLIEASSILPKFKELYCPSTIHSNSSSANTQPDKLTLSINALLSVTSHYTSLLSSSTNTNTTKSKSQHQSPSTVQKVIKEGYETLPDLTSTVSPTGTPMIGSAGATGGVIGGGNVVDFGYRSKWRESEWKGEIKRILRTVVEDARGVALR